MIFTSTRAPAAALVLGASAARAGGEGQKQNPTVLFHWQFFVLRQGKCAFAR
jgi:hypothetical protein